MTGHAETCVRPSATAEQAAQWCLIVHDEGLSDDERVSFDAWLLRDPAHRAAFERARAAWELTAPDRAPASTVRLRVDALGQLRTAPLESGRWRRLGAAAAFALIVLSAALLLLVPQRPDVYETGRGERRVVILADGSRLSLDASTRVEVAYNDGRRALRLIGGRARFDVRQDPLRPFSVAALDKLVVATGTSFSVELLRQELRVVLYEGEIAVLEEDLQTGARRNLLTGTGSQRLIDLQPGRELTLAAGESPTVAEVDLVRARSWEAGQLVFDDEPLSTAVEIVNRYSTETTIVADTRAADVKVSGVFTTGDTASFVEGVTGVFPIRAVRVGNRIRLVPVESAGAAD